MSNVLVDEQYLKDIANAIREKTQNVDKLKPGKMDEAILDITTDKPDQEKTVTPSAEQQIVEPDEGYELSRVIVEPGIDTSDATATSSDIISPKTAYVNGEKIEGSIIPTYSPAEQILTTIGDANTQQIQYCGFGYIVKITNTDICVYQLLDNQSEVNFITSYDISGIANLKLSSFTISMVTSDNDIRMVACRTDKDGNLFYFRFVILTNTIEYVGNFRPHGQGSMYTYGGFNLKISPTGKIMMLFIGQANNDGGTLFTLLLNTTSIHTAKQLWYTKYGHSSSDMQFFDNDTKMSLTIDSTQYRYVLNNLSVINTYSSNITNTLLMSNNLQYGYSRKDNAVVKLSGDWTSLTKEIIIRNFSSTDTYKGLFSNNFIVINNTLYKIVNDELEELLSGLYNVNMSTDNISAVLRLTDSTEQIVVNVNAFDEMILVSLNKDGKQFTDTSNINITSNKVLTGNKFVNSNGVNIGTMPNNGELVTSSTEEIQTFTEGYYSNIIVNPVSFEDHTEYQECLTISEEILS